MLRWAWVSVVLWAGVQLPPAPPLPASVTVPTRELALCGASRRPLSPEGGLCPRPTSDPAPLLASRVAGPSSLTLCLPAGFFPRAEAVTKLQFEPSGNRETSPPPPPGLGAMWSHSWISEPQGAPPRGQRKQALRAGVPAGAAPRLA